MGPTTTTPAQTGQDANAQERIGTVRQPTLADPGWVTGITLGELYTDNLRLAAGSKPKQTSWITQIQPFIKAAYSGPHFSGLFDYRITGDLYPGQAGYNQLTQNLKAQATFTIDPQHLFVDATALYGSRVINNQLASSPSTYFLSNNRANVATATVSPYWVQDLGSAGIMKLRYSHGRVVYNTRGIPAQRAGVLYGISNVKSNALQFSLVSPKGRSWGWDLQYSNQRIKQDAATKGVDFEVAKLGTYVEVSTSARLLADAGKENKFLPDGTVEKMGARFWDAGFSWANSLYRLKALVGHHFYGRSYQFSWERTGALLTTSLRYEERPTDLNQQLLGQNPGQLIASPIGESVLPSLLERRIYLMKRATASADYLMPKGNLRVTLYDERRTFIMLGNRQEKIANANVDWLFDIGAFTTLTPTLGWQRYTFQDGQVSHNTYEQLALVHQ
ncbi:TIGR03016 family PEP-CTERM system-associated outer membrane protein, partial [Oleiagrimonas sp.]|uniref:TIGR03016 family PEP-CTERM system-associated outer membrane protein n=1 Tax=Oleiagrimonas sp. TaxID=2010330 RepID=UPI0026270166